MKRSGLDNLDDVLGGDRIHSPEDKGPKRGCGCCLGVLVFLVAIPIISTVVNFWTDLVVFFFGGK